MRTRAADPSTIVLVLVLASGAFVHRAAAQKSAGGAQESRASADSARLYGESASVFNAHRVTRVINEGSHVVLADGTIWEVYLPDRPSVNTWRVGDVLIVRESSVSQGEYDYLLKDGRTRGAVYARLVGEAN